MLQEPDEHAPYGWTHCLTLPQAIAGLAGDGLDAGPRWPSPPPTSSGFRAALGQRRLVAGYAPEPVDAPASLDFEAALAGGPAIAAAAAWHAPDDALDDVVATLATARVPITTTPIW